MMSPGKSEVDDPVDVVTFGETMLALRSPGLIRLGGPMTSSIAGAEANVAIGLARLGHMVRWSGRVGADEAGELVVRTLRAEGVDVRDVERDGEAGTGLVMFEQRLPDVTRVQYHRRGSAGSRLTAENVLTGLRQRPALLHLTGITPALSRSARDAALCAADAAREQGWTVCFDVNFRSALWSPEEAAPVLRSLALKADVVVASPEELQLVTDSPEELLTMRPREVVLKLGARGARAHLAGSVVESPGLEVGVVDSVGAGDAFCAGYISAMLDGSDVAGRLARGNTLGAFAVTQHGDWEGLPSRAELSLMDLGAGTTIR